LTENNPSIKSKFQVLSYEPNAEQTTSAILFKATAFMKNNYYNEAIEVLQELPGSKLKLSVYNMVGQNKCHAF
jgi:hypothetical protein